MIRRRWLAAAAGAAFLAGGVAVAPPAGADPIDPIGEFYAGLTCGLVHSGDPFEPDPDAQWGTATGGPWVVVGADSVTMTCIVSVGDGVMDAYDTALSQTGSIGSVSGPVGYRAGPADQVWLCTIVTWTYPDVPGAVTPGTGSWGGDAGDPDGNPFCDLT